MTDWTKVGTGHPRVAEVALREAADAIADLFPTHALAHIEVAVASINDYIAKRKEMGRPADLDEDDD